MDLSDTKTEIFDVATFFVQKLLVLTLLTPNRMSKFYTAGLLSMCFSLCLSFVQGQAPPGSTTLAAGCDTINLPTPAIWGKANYQLTGFNTGFWTGTNSFNDKEKAHFFNITGSPNAYITRCYIEFAKAATGNAANLNKAILIKVYDGTSNTPGSLLGSASTTLGNIRNDVQLNDRTDIVFPSAIALPASKKFFVSVDFSTLSWTTDSLAIYSSLSGRTPSLAWEKWNDNSWHPTLEESGLTLSLYMNPFVSPTTNCQVLVPVKLSSFNGLSTSKGHLLQWATASEQMNKGFHVEHSADGQHFTTIGFVPSMASGGNSNLPLQYSFLYRPAAGNNESIYRLKQQDLNGVFSYSKLVFLKNSGFESSSIGRIYPNPAGSILVVDWVKAIQKGAQFRIVDGAGRIMKQQLLAETVKQTSISTAGLATGMYILQVLDYKQQITDTEKFWID